MRSIRIKNKLFIAFFMIALLGGGIALINLGSARNLAQGVSSIGHNLEKVQSIMVVHDHVQAIMASEMRLLSRGLSRLERQAHYRDLEGSFAALEETLRSTEILVKDQQEKQLLAVLYGQWQKWRRNGEEYLELCQRLDNTDILDPLQFQNTLFHKKEEAYRWVMTLSEAIGNEAPFVGATSEKESELGIWLFGISSENSSLAVAIGKARKPLDSLYHSARKINRLIASDRSKISDLLIAVYESETLPAKNDLFMALDLMIVEAEKASAIYALMATKVDQLSQQFAEINKNLKHITSTNSAQAATVIAAGTREITLSSTVSMAALPVGLAAIFFLSIMLGKLITRPLINLHKVMEHYLETGDFSSKVEVDGHDEIAQVGRSFNDMVDQFNFYHHELEKKNEVLGEYQEELSRANEELEFRSHFLEENIATYTQELALQQEKMAELNDRLLAANDELSLEINKHRATRAELQDANEISEAVDKTKTAFLANMSHEIRTPMNAIIGLTSLALKQEVSAKVHDYLRTVKKSANGLLVILDDILDFSKIEAGQLDLEEINFNLDDVLENIRLLFGDRARDKNIDFEVRLTDDVPLDLIGDPFRLSQVLVNLAGNALKFIHQGQVTIMVAVQESKGKKVDLLFTISDTGIGIDESRQQFLFDAFSQADESISRQFGGTGIGLAVSKRIVERCGGQIWFESVPGRGSSFHFTISLERQVQVCLPSKYKEMFAANRVLVVDDNKMFRHFMAKMFTSFCFEVETAESGEDALDRLREMANLGALPHVILLDQNMPGMDGLSLVKILSQEREFAEISIVIISADGQDIGLRRRAEQVGVKVVLSKPVKRELLLSSLEVLLQDKSAGRAREKVAARAFETLAGHRLLLVEDNSINMEVTTELLIDVGVEVVTAVDGADALAKVGQGFDAVLMDVLMPRLNGIEAARQMRRRPELAGLPIIAMTAGVMRGDRDKCLEAGMNEYITKPIEPESLYQILLDVLRPAGHGAGQTPSPERLLADGDLVIPGIDVVGALARINNNHNLFVKLLTEFVGDNSDVIADMTSYFQAGEIDKVIYIVHTLKGVAGNLGADSLRDVAQSIEKILRKEAQMPADLLADLENRLKEVIEGVRIYTGQKPDGDNRVEIGELLPLVDDKELYKILMTLLSHIEANTPRAEKFLLALPHYDSSDFEEGRKEIEAFLEKFDFEAARTSLFQLAAKIGVQLNGQ